MARVHRRQLAAADPFLHHMGAPARDVAYVPALAPLQELGAPKDLVREEPRFGRVAARIVQLRADVGRDGVPWRALRHDMFEGAVPPRDEPLDQGGVDALLRREVVIHVRLGEAALLGDFLDLRAVEALGDEQADRRAQDPLLVAGANPGFRRPLARARPHRLRHVRLSRAAGPLNRATV